MTASSAQDPGSGGPARPPRVLVVEDDPDVRYIVEVALQQTGYAVSVEASGANLQRVAAVFRPDLAILDVNFPNGPDGLTMARQLRDVSSVPILFLTAAASLEDRLAGFQAGADDYLVKPFAIAELLARVRALLLRSGRLDAPAFEIDDCTIDVDGRIVTRSGHDIALTRTEFDLLVTLARDPGKVISKSQLLARVWGFDAYDVHLVEVHMSSLRRKLHAHGSPLLQTVRGVGYVLRVASADAD
ncbi:MAG: response regulator transcription factor [Actinobacteria bacterium]|nr:response regulator transcription factor [Actinomycetota bacterium]MBV9254281.1 response regulator transcription factor [Actinomycetota bacterium]MBV9666341.1 response regulator transcription factor [Actinomycetota bacterium]